MTTPPPSIFGEPGEPDPQPEGDAPGSLFAWAQDHAADDDDAAGLDVADRYPTREDRRRAFEQWQRDGRRFPPPRGLTSACLGALIRGREDRDA